MKPKSVEYIPIYGIFKYFNRYFSGINRTEKEALLATWFEMYHIFVAVILGIIVLLNFY